MPKAILIDFSKLPSPDPDRERQRLYMERVAAKARSSRETRLDALNKENDGLERALKLIAALSKEGGDRAEVRVRPGFIVATKSRKRQPDPALLPQRAAAHAGRLAEARATDVNSRPPCTQLVHRRSLALPFEMSALFVAACTTAPGHAFENPLPLTPLRRGWATLLGWRHAPEPARRQRARRALLRLEQADLVELGPHGHPLRLENFRLLKEDHARGAYTVPGQDASLALPAAFFINGWHLVLTPNEVATWLMIRHLAWRFPDSHRVDGVGAVESDRWGRYGLTSEVFESHHELAEFGLIETTDPVPGRRNGKVAKNLAAEGQLQTYRFKLRDVGLHNDALTTVRDQLSRFPIPPRLI